MERFGVLESLELRGGSTRVLLSKVLLPRAPSRTCQAHFTVRWSLKSSGLGGGAVYCPSYLQ